MAWTAPMTAVENTIFTSTQYNTYVRDNMLETAPAKLTAAGMIPVGNGLNSIVGRSVSGAAVGTPQATTSTTFTDLATVGPTVTLTTGARALVLFAANEMNSVTNGASVMSVAVSGATTIAAADSNSATLNGITAANADSCASFIYFSALTPGSNTFTCKYRVTSGTGTFSARSITVIPL